VGPHGARGSGPEGSKGFLILAARWPSTAVVVGAAAATRATRVFWLQLPFGRPRFRDASGIVTDVSVFFPLPFR
jgi:hypothetical protein